MKCMLCGRKTNCILKVIDGVTIFECLSCRLGFVDQKKIKKQNLSHLYKIAEYKKLEGMLKKRSEKVVKLLRQYISSGSVLEVGPGFGLLSSALLDSGNYKLEVVEPELSPYYLKRKNYTWTKMDLETFLKRKNRKYDMIIMFDVIEHLFNPVDSLQKLYKLLKPNGILVIQTPNYDSVMQKLCAKWSWWMVEDHKCFFSPKSITALLERTGYSLKMLSTHEDFIDFKKNLDGNWGYIRSKILRRAVKAVYLSIFVPFYFILRGVLWKLGKGGLLLVIAKKIR